MERLHRLSAEEKQLVLDVPALVTILIAGADGKIDHTEENRARRAVTFRSHIGDPFLFEYYKVVEQTFEDRLAFYIAQFSTDADIRTVEVSQKLSDVTPILTKVEKVYAKSLLENWKNLAKAVASESGGFLGYFSISTKERPLISLDMISLSADD